MTQKTIVGVVVGVVAVIGIIIFLPKETVGQYDAFAQCIAQSGAKFYGAFWCPHCQDQKALFGPSKRLLPYIECSTPDGQRKTQECTDKNIESYPTWEFGNSTTTRLTGVVSLQTLAERTNCSLATSTPIK